VGPDLSILYDSGQINAGRAWSWVAVARSAAQAPKKVCDFQHSTTDPTTYLAGGTDFGPDAGTLISVANIGSEGIHLTFVFSAPGFAEFMQDESVREGEKNVPLSKAEDDEIQKKLLHAVICQ
jgi:hypothetical protein